MKLPTPPQALARLFPASLAARTARMIAAYASKSWQGEPSGLRAWKCTIEAPASRISPASRPISSADQGTFGLRSRIAYSFTRTSMMSFFMPPSSGPYRRPYALQSGLLPRNEMKSPPPKAS